MPSPNQPTLFGMALAGFKRKTSTTTGAEEEAARKQRTAQEEDAIAAMRAASAQAASVFLNTGVSKHPKKKQSMTDEAIRQRRCRAAKAKKKKAPPARVKAAVDAAKAAERDVDDVEKETHKVDARGRIRKRTHHLSGARAKRPAAGRRVRGGASRT